MEKLNFIYKLWAKYIINLNLNVVYKNNYVTCKLVGRLGNNLFQIANCVSQGIRSNKPFYIPLQNIPNYYAYKTNILRNINFLIYSLPDDGVDVVVPGFSHSNVFPLEDKKTIFHGFFQSEKYFSDYEQLIRWLFEPSLDFKKKMYKKFPELLSSVITCIHVRRGDFLERPDTFPVVGLEYILEGIKHIPHTDGFFIFSDDIPWCKKNINLPNIKFISLADWEELWLMSLCHHFIIPNSTFGWWAAYLSRNKGKKVITPSTWLHPRFNADTSDIPCRDWIVLPTKTEGSLIIPT